MNHLERINQKIHTLDSIRHQCAIWRFLEKTIVFSNGCFDILHRGHIDYLSLAADAGHVLIVGLNSDQSVQALKGPKRPVHPEEARLVAMASLFFVDAVVLFDEETPYNLIEAVRPDVLVKGSDYAPDQIVGADLVKSYGGTVLTIPLTPGYSTTGLIQKLQD